MSALRLGSFDLGRGQYGRFFGAAPTRDIHRLREEHHSGAEAPT